MKKIKLAVCAASISIILGTGFISQATSNLPDRVDNSTLPCFPPIIDQGNAESCQSVSTTYYLMTHMTGLKRNLDAKNNPSNRFSPLWTYNFLNKGHYEFGSYNHLALRVLYHHGAPSLTQLPYSIDVNSIRGWNYGADTWLSAMKNRIDDYGIIDIGNDGDETPVKGIDDIEELKSYLSKGYIFSFDTSSLGYWEFKTIKDDPNTTADNNGSPIGKKIAYAVTGTGKGGGHIMTLVGYDDNVWTDINGNGRVDAGEKGALKIANSWGEDQSVRGLTTGDGGYIWLSYDALNRISTVQNAPSFDNRQYAFSGNGFHDKNVLYWLTAKKYYTPELIGKFTINDNRRCDLNVSLGYSDLNSTVPTDTIQFAIFDDCEDTLFDKLSNFDRLGFFNFAGTRFEYVDGTFYFDFNDLIKKHNLADGKQRRWYLIVKDEGDEKGSTIKNFELLDHSLNVIASTGSIQKPIGDTDNNPLYLDAAVKLMDAPKNPKALFKGQYINFTWDRVDSNAEYEVSVNDGPFVDTELYNSYTQKANAENKNYKFKVRAVSPTSGRTSAVSQTLIVKSILRGDINGNGSINSDDLNLLNSYLNNQNTALTLIQKSAADVNGDGVLDTKDAVMLNALLSGTITALPSPIKLINVGDVNRDGAIDNNDFDLLYAHLLNNTATPLNVDQQVASDVNGDGNIDIIDASIIKKYANGSINQFPIE
ncbi:MAG TPA: dockerin type I domain-containing protein [Pseudobacteroides sp.]|nr:dockerin type I domain-containing protein [Pseudobacteroides sp.]